MDSTDRIALSWSAVGPDAITQKFVWVNGNPITPVNESVAAKNGSYTLSAVFGPIAPGTHTYTIAAGDNSGYLSYLSGSFTVQNAGAVIDRVLVAEATPKNGQLDWTDQLVVTWAVEGAASVQSKSLKIDGVPISTIYGPYTGPAGAIYFAGVFGPLLAGTHYYSISSAGPTGATATSTGSFKVIGASSTISNVMVVEATPKNGVLNSTDQLLLTWTAGGLQNVASSSLNVDGKAVASVYGPYAAGAGAWNMAGVFGPLAAGTHTYAIRSTDSIGNTASYSGSFNVVAALMIEAAASPAGQAASLYDAQLQPIAAAAEQRWTAALGKNASAVLDGVSVQLADLSGGLLGETSGKTILIDRDAAGYGWFVDPTPNDDAEFGDVLGSHTLAARNGTAAAARVDLLTTVMHELGHVLGESDLVGADDLMNGDLPLGERRTLSTLDVIEAGAANHQSTDRVFAAIGS